MRGKVRIGAPCSQLIQYYFEYCIRFLEYLIVPESQNPVSLRTNKRITVSIVRGMLLVLTAIKFNHKLYLHARKVRHISIDWHLTAKSETSQLPEPQMPPQ